MVPTSPNEQEGSGGQAVRAYLASRREEMRQAIDKLRKLDGSTTSSLSLLTDIRVEDIERLGGISEDA
ncbi:hypothetical protein LUW76_12885 [Actinomadura madurae]|uniref:hypothetical protein n=1 Tax=Actinomadura madurae TaxID=1993 RepID=UPI00202716B2|nr:hypothetical protein [Actinomadura madurae]URM95137.1 hypothetical protein LUW76_12885 [Actinomadura madurae]